MASINSAQWNRAYLVVLILVDMRAAIKSIPARVVEPIYLLREGPALCLPQFPAIGSRGATSLSSRGSAYVDDGVRSNLFVAALAGSWSTSPTNRCCRRDNPLGLTKL